MQMKNGMNKNKVLIKTFELTKLHTEKYYEFT